MSEPFIKKRFQTSAELIATRSPVQNGVPLTSRRQYLSEMLSLAVSAFSCSGNASKAYRIASYCPECRYDDNMSTYTEATHVVRLCERNQFRTDRVLGRVQKTQRHRAREIGAVRFQARGSCRKGVITSAGANLDYDQLSILTHNRGSSFITSILVHSRIFVSRASRSQETWVWWKQQNASLSTCLSRHK